MLHLTRFIITLGLAIMLRFGSGRMIYSDYGLSNLDYPNSDQDNTFELYEPNGKRSEGFQSYIECPPNVNCSSISPLSVSVTGEKFVSKKTPKTVEALPYVFQKLNPRMESVTKVLRNNPVILIWPVYKN